MQYLTQINDLWDLRAGQGLMQSFGTAKVSETGESSMHLTSWICLLSELTCFHQPVPLPSPSSVQYSERFQLKCLAVGDLHVTNWQRFQVTYSAGGPSCSTVLACNSSNS